MDDSEEDDLEDEDYVPEIVNKTFLKIAKKPVGKKRNRSSEPDILIERKKEVREEV